MKGISDQNQLVSIDVLNEEWVDCATAMQPLGIGDENRVPDWTLTGVSCRRIGESLNLVVVALPGSS